MMYGPTGAGKRISFVSKETGGDRKGGLANLTLPF